MIAMCTGPCPREWTYPGIGMTLDEQLRGIRAVQESHYRQWFSSLTPNSMRQELADLGKRITKAKHP